MAQIDSTYDELISLTAAHCGQSQFSPADQDIINTFLNQAARRMYRASDFWERYLVVAQPRSVVRGYVATSEDSYEVYGAGYGGANGLYVREGTENSKARYYKYDSTGEIPTIKLFFSGGDWRLQTMVAVTLDGEPVTFGGEQVYVADTILYDITSASDTPPLTGWSANQGDSPVPLLEDVADIDTFLAIYRYDNVDDRWSIPFTFHVGHRGAKIHIREDHTPVYVTYKKKFTDLFGDGEGGTTSTIPSEWFDYMSLDAARKFHIANRQANGNQQYPIISLTEVQAAMDDQLMQLESQQTIDTIGKRIKTNITHDRTLS